MASTTHSAEHHITPVSTYVKVYLALVVLTAITVALTKIDFGVLNTLVAMIVATVKATLVILWFMHQKYEHKLNRAIFFSSFAFLILLAFFCSVDIFTRVNMTQIKDFSIPKSKLMETAPATEAAPKAESKPEASAKPEAAQPEGEKH